MKGYTVIYKRDEGGYWVAAVRGVKGCHSQGRSLSEARARIREALSLFVDDAERAELHDRVKLPGELQAVVGAVRRKAARLEQLDAQVRAERVRLVKRLVRERRLSRRDAAELVGLSFQRVQQIVGK